MSLTDEIREGTGRLLALPSVVSENDIYEAIGLMGTAGKALQFTISIPDKIFSRHLYIFMKAAQKGDIHKQSEFKQKMISDIKYARGVAEAIIEQINRCDSEKKASYVGRIFTAGIVEGNMEVSQFVRLVQIINSLYINEIEYLIRLKGGEIDETSDIIEHLIATAVLTRTYGEIGFGNIINPQRRPALTDAGNQLIAILQG